MSSKQIVQSNFLHYSETGTVLRVREFTDSQARQRTKALYLKKTEKNENAPA